MADTSLGVSATVIPGPPTTQTPLDVFKGQISYFLSEVKADAKGGYTLAEIGKDSYDFIHLAVAGIDSINGLSGPDKKAIVTQAVGQLFDTVSPFIPLPMVLQPFRSMEMATIKPMFISLADGVIEAAVARLHSTPAVVIDKSIPSTPVN